MFLHILGISLLLSDRCQPSLIKRLQLKTQSPTFCQNSLLVLCGPADLSLSTQTAAVDQQFYRIRINQFIIIDQLAVDTIISCLTKILTLMLILVDIFLQYYFTVKGALSQGIFSLFWRHIFKIAFQDL